MSDPTAAKAAKPPAGTPAGPAATSAAGVKETVESILVALILAFIFRAFVVEAFVIPTGSMATTLLGAHVRFTCDDCGYRFNHNISAGPDMQVKRVLSGSRIGVFCPNCQFQNELTSPAAYYGDRILVLKYLYLFQEPQRWDVVVFKDPHKAPHEDNFIKRLVGKPGEQVMILDGDIYVRNRDDQAWQVQHKPRVVQEELWRIIYDNDHQPQGLVRDGRWRQPWQSDNGSGWETDSRNPRAFRFSNPEEAGRLRFEPQLLPTPRGLAPGGDFTDWLSYNLSSRFEFYSATPVSDLKLRLYYERHEGSGPLRLHMSKREQNFIAEIGPDQAAILLQTEDGEPVPWQEPVALPAGGPLLIEFTNVDYVVTLRVNGRDLISAAYEPNIKGLLEEYRLGVSPPMPRVEIEADRQECSISHLGLWRDIYYINYYINQRIHWGNPANPIQLAADEYFVLGDNSINSADARQWDTPVNLPHEELWVDPGRVPGRFMLGKAFFVYWPAGYRPLTPWMPGVVPNFGEMRFIH